MDADELEFEDTNLVFQVFGDHDFRATSFPGMS